MVRFAALAVSIAVFPPPMMTTFLPISRFPSFALKSARNESALTGSPFSRRSTPGSDAPTATITAVYPAFLSISSSLISVFKQIFTPIFSRSAASLSMEADGIRNSGITWRTTPPRASFFSKSVTSIPALLKKYAAAIPAGPPPMTAALPALVTAGADSFSIYASYPFSAAISFMLRICTGSS